MCVHWVRVSLILYMGEVSIRYVGVGKWVYDWRSAYRWPANRGSTNWWFTSVVISYRSVSFIYILSHQRHLPVIPYLLSTLISHNFTILPPPLHDLIFTKEILAPAMKTIPLKIPHIIVPIHKRKPPFPTFNILLIPSCIHIPCKVPVNSLSVFQPTKELTFVDVAVWIVVGAMALHKVVDEVALVYGAVGELVWSLAGEGLVLELAFVLLGFNYAWGEFVLDPCALHESDFWGW